MPPSSASSPVPLVPSGFSYFELRTTTHGGRSLFATSDIEPWTRIHSDDAPFAHVIYRDYRKEVCAHCFAYSASAHASSIVGSCRTWSVKWCRAGTPTVWFCSDVCKNSWERDKVSVLLMEVDAFLTKGQIATRKRFKSPEEELVIKAVFPSLKPGSPAITQEIIDAAWKSVETLIASKAHFIPYYSTLHLEDMELEIARSLAAVIVRRYCDEHHSASDRTPGTTQNRSVSWSQLLELQTNELRDIQTRPYMLTAYLRIYVFLSHALPKYLQRYVSTVREVLARDTGNSFGIWDGDLREEMIGWGIWVNASYFNHSCMPNVRKKREGRALHFEVTRKIQAGEELCISYIDTESSVDQRRRELEESWFFTCHCHRCENEST